MVARQRYPEAEQFLKALPFPGARAQRHVRVLAGLLHKLYIEGFEAGELHGGDVGFVEGCEAARRGGIIARMHVRFLNRFR